MIFTFTGTNSYMLQAELQKRVGEFVTEHTDMAVEKLDGEEADYQRIHEALTSLPFLVSKRLVVLRAPSANKQFVEKFVDLLPDISDETDVIIIEPKLDKRSSYYKALKSKTEYKEFAELDQFGLAKWLVSTAAELGAKIHERDARLLVDRVGTNQQLLANEIRKLAVYDPAISRETIELLTEKAPQSTIFELIEAAMSGDARRALSIYAEQRTLKVEPQQIIAMLAWQLHVLATVKVAGQKNPNEIAAEARINPFVVKKTQNLASKTTYQDIKSQIHELLQIDLALKRRSIDADEILQNYILTLGQK